MPDAQCPNCRAWAARQDWQAVPQGSFPFTIRCPGCGAHADIADIGYRLGAVTPPRTSALASERAAG